MAEWSDEDKAKLVADYKAKNPTPETSAEIVSELADELGVTVNGARAILVREKVYVNKTPGSSKSSNSSGEKKESKADSLKRLNTVIESQGLEPDEDIIGRLTGKAAAYFADVITKATE